VIVGESEMLEGKFGLKNLQTGEQATLSFEDLKAQLS
jgi:histidyl-tRNA synthetase